MTKDELIFYFMPGFGILFIFASPLAWWINLLATIGVFLAPILLPLASFLLIVFKGSKVTGRDVSDCVKLRNNHG